MDTPASRHISTRRRAPLSSVEPHALKKSPLPPNVPQPKLSAGTVKPDAPNRLYSILCLSRSWRARGLPLYACAIAGNLGARRPGSIARSRRFSALLRIAQRFLGVAGRVVVDREFAALLLADDPM